jgi:hypothetical protein
MIVVKTQTTAATTKWKEERSKKDMRKGRKLIKVKQSGEKATHCHAMCRGHVTLPKKDDSSSNNKKGSNLWL